MQTTANGGQIDFTQAAQSGDRLVSMLSEQREQAPLHWNDSLRGWLVLRHEDVTAGYRGDFPLSDKKLDAFILGSVSQEERESRFPALCEGLRYWLNNMDPPEHTRLRKLLMRAFSRDLVEIVRPFVSSTIEATLAEAARCTTVDLVNDVAKPITCKVILHLLGVGSDNLDRMAQWTNAMVKGLSPAASVDELDNLERVFSAMRTVFLAEIGRRRRAPGDDFLSRVVVANEGGEMLSDSEILSSCYLLQAAGHESTANSMVLGTLVLLEQPAAREVILADDARLNGCVMEIMRHSSVSTVNWRLVTEDFQWHGNQIRKGQRVYFLIPSANRDPRVFPHPESFDPARPVQPSVVFGKGIHMCIGHLLARMELAEFFPRLLRTGITVLDSERRFTPGLQFRGLEKLTVKIGSADQAQ